MPPLVLLPQAEVIVSLALLSALVRWRVPVCLGFGPDVCGFPTGVPRGWMVWLTRGWSGWRRFWRRWHRPLLGVGESGCAGRQWLGSTAYGAPARAVGFGSWLLPLLARLLGRWILSSSVLLGTLRPGRLLSCTATATTGAMSSSLWGVCFLFSSPPSTAFP